MLMLLAAAADDDYDFNKTEVKCLQPTVIVIRFKVENVCNSFYLSACDYCCGYGNETKPVDALNILRNH